jgi:hypothetical protein
MLATPITIVALVIAFSASNEPPPFAPEYVWIEKLNVPGNAVNVRTQVVWIAFVEHPGDEAETFATTGLPTGL